MKRLSLLLALACTLLVGVVLVRTLRVGPTLPAVVPAAEVTVPAGAVERLAGAIRFPTLSNEDSDDFDAVTFQALHEYLTAEFPRLHAALERETVATHSLLYTWRGTDLSARPILLAAHLDVVPVEPVTEPAWDEEPFGGRVMEGFVWGRGTLDNKSALLGIMEAVELLLDEGFRPLRTVYLAFGHDEELGGMGGARTIAALLKNRNVELEMVLDEGGAIVAGSVPEISAPIALVGIAEKGFVSVELSVRAAGGHSSLPTRDGVIGILSAAIARLEASPMPARLEGPARQLLEEIGPALPFPRSAALANLWATAPLVARYLERNPGTNAMIRTTTAVTMFQAGTKDNVLPSHARAVVNFRVLQGDSVADVLKHVRRVIDDPRVEVEPVGAFSAEPSAVSSTDSESFRMLERTIRETVPDTIVAPYLVSVATDARHYSELATNVFRFLPIRLEPIDIERFHGTNERIAVRDYERAIRFYRQLVLNAAGG
jgi:carboxypeptidase PM20D1